MKTIIVVDKRGVLLRSFQMVTRRDVLDALAIARYLPFFAGRGGSRLSPPNGLTFFKYRTGARLTA